METFQVTVTVRTSAARIYILTLLYPRWKVLVQQMFFFRRGKVEKESSMTGKYVLLSKTFMSLNTNSKHLALEEDYMTKIWLYFIYGTVKLFRSTWKVLGKHGNVHVYILSREFWTLVRNNLCYVFFAEIYIDLF